MNWLLISLNIILFLMWIVQIIGWKIILGHHKASHYVNSEFLKLRRIEHENLMRPEKSE